MEVVQQVFDGLKDKAPRGKVTATWLADLTGLSNDRTGGWLKGHSRDFHVLAGFAALFQQAGRSMDEAFGIEAAPDSQQILERMAELEHDVSLLKSGYSRLLDWVVQQGLDITPSELDDYRSKLSEAARQGLEKAGADRERVRGRRKKAS